MPDTLATVPIQGGTLTVDTTALIAAVTRALASTTFTPTPLKTPVSIVQMADLDGTRNLSSSASELLNPTQAGNLGLVFVLDYSNGACLVTSTAGDKIAVVDEAGANPVLYAQEIAAWVGGPTTINLTPATPAQLAAFVAELTPGVIVGMPPAYVGPGARGTVLTTDTFTVTESMLPCTMYAVAVNASALGLDPIIAPVPEFQSEMELIRFIWALGALKPRGCFVERLITLPGDYAAQFTVTSSAADSYLISAVFVQPK